MPLGNRIAIINDQHSARGPDAFPRDPARDAGYPQRDGGGNDDNCTRAIVPTEECVSSMNRYE